jgi:hypothetical protein
MGQTGAGELEVEYFVTQGRGSRVLKAGKLTLGRSKKNFSGGTKASFEAQL